ncbi:MAG: cytochrome c biogenesis protein CcsA [Planctomycetota bacterium]|nr:cytochrome c biogenesis protein CcsA [Planctomycetota bacterium]
MKHRFAILITCILGASLSAAEPTSFKDQVDMSIWSETVAVYTEGRVKSFETFSRSYMPFIMGTKLIDNQSASFTFFDMMIMPQKYMGKDIVYVKNKNLRAAIIGEAIATTPELAEQRNLFMKRGLISREVLQQPAVLVVLAKLRQDVMRFSSPVERIESAIAASDPRSLWGSLRIVPPVSGKWEDPWTTLDTVVDQEIISSWGNMVTAWQSGDATVVNKELATLSTLLPKLASGSDLYPSSIKLKLESLYFRLGNFTAIWLVYLMSIILLLMAFVYRFTGVGRAGILLFVLAATLHTIAVIWRWYVSGRFPNANMFEAITTASWMGVVFGLCMETLVRRTSKKYIFSLGSAMAAMAALLATRLYPLELSPHISNKMPVLHDVWLYIHTNFIIFSYCLIFIAAVSAAIYLIRRLIQKRKGQDGTIDFARSGGVASFTQARPDNKPESVQNLGAVLDGATMTLVEISFILLWAGIVMGAIWADHSWGRPWGWDPKEVFALNTFLIFVVLIHVRMKVKDKGFWTAILALAGCGVMLFNWIIINFTISGLHSYA